MTTKFYLDRDFSKYGFENAIDNEINILVDLLGDQYVEYEDRKHRLTDHRRPVRKGWLFFGPLLSLKRGLESCSNDPHIFRLIYHCRPRSVSL